MRGNGAGFTLLELMVTTLVVTVGAAVAIPSFINALKNNRLAAYTNELSAALTLARSEAVKRNLPVVVCRSANATASVPTCTSGTGKGGWEVGWLVFADVNKNGIYDSSDLLLHRRGALTGGLTVIGTNNVANRVSFNSRGIVPGGMGSLRFDDGRSDGVRLICLPVTGRVRIALPSNADGCI